MVKQLDRIVAQTERLIKLCMALRQENNLLKAEHQSLQSTLNDYKNQNESLEERIKALQLAKHLLKDNNNCLDIQEKIDEFVQGIDKCIVLLRQ